MGTKKCQRRGCPFAAEGKVWMCGEVIMEVCRYDAEEIALYLNGDLHISVINSRLRDIDKERNRVIRKIIEMQEGKNGRGNKETARANSPSQ